MKTQLEKGTNSDYWTQKIARNIERDSETDRRLKALGWTPLHFWGKDITRHTDDCIKVIEETIFNLKIGENGLI